MLRSNPKQELTKKTTAFAMLSSSDVEQCCSRQAWTIKKDTWVPPVEVYSTQPFKITPIMLPFLPRPQKKRQDTVMTCTTSWERSRNRLGHDIVSMDAEDVEEHWAC